MIPDIFFSKNMFFAFLGGSQLQNVLGKISPVLGHVRGWDQDSAIPLEKILTDVVWDFCFGAKNIDKMEKIGQNKSGGEVTLEFP